MLKGAAKLKRQTVPNIDEDVGQLEMPDIAGGSILEKLLSKTVWHYFLKQIVCISWGILGNIPFQVYTQHKCM